MLANLFKDLYFQFKGRFFENKNEEYKFAFLVHSRGYKDIYRKYPNLSFLPKSIIVFIMNNLWPVTLSRVTGVYSIDTRQEVNGYVLGITATSDYLLKNRKSALKKIRSAVYLARGRGARIIGLGGLTSSLSGGGINLLDIDINITTGHAYTAYNVTQNLFKLVDIMDVPKNKLKVAIVGAAGSVGSTSSLLIAREGFLEIVLIDLERKSANLIDLKNQIDKMTKNSPVTISHTVSDIHNCDFVITATNTPEALITEDIVEDGMIIIDDAQPSDIDDNVLKMSNVLVLEAGVVHTPGINSNFNYGLKNRTDNFCCMAEVIILASHQWEDHYVINRATLEHVDSISEMGKKLGFEVASFQNFMESVSQDKINNVKSILRKKHGL